MPSGDRGLPDLVLFDRDGTLVRDFPYNGDPHWVRPVDGAREALDRLRARGVRVGVVSNQSGVARGLITVAQVEACNARLAELLGPFDVVRYCPHGPDDGCTCRKPAPGLVTEACAELGVDPARCVVVGDVAADVDAGTAAGAAGILVPTRRLDADVDGQSQRHVLAATLDTLPDRLSRGGTGLYDTTLAAVRAAQADYNPDAVNSVLIVTDGANDDDQSIGLQELLDTLTSEANPDRPVKVIGVALGPDADLDVLKQIADATGGAAYSAVNPADLQSVLFDAIRERG